MKRTTRCCPTLGRLVPLAALLCTVHSAALAKEGGDQYPNGAEAREMVGALPPPGDYFINYAGYYGGTLVNEHGDKANLGGRNAKVDAWFDALRYVKVSHTKVLGADWGWHVIVPLVHQSMDFPPLGGRSSTNRLGDITIDPLVLGWHFGPLHMIAGLDINLPTGSYDKNDTRVSTGANYYSFEPVLALSYLSESGWDGSVKLMYNIKTRNKDTDYQSGDEFHADYWLGKHAGPWSYGLGGYYLKQTTDDKQNGQVVAAAPGVYSQGRRGQVLAIGPSVGYTTPQGVSLIAQWQHETLVENRFAGDKLWFKLITAF